METVSLNKCMWCGLLWVEDGDPFCPRCRHRHTAPRAAVIAGVEVTVKDVVLRGDEMGLHDGRVRRGLESIQLGLRCKHGYLASYICPLCNKI